MKNKVLVIIPTYNEREHISLLIKAISKIDENISILIVDDNSPDGTGSLVDELQKEYLQLFVLHRSKKEGLGKAYLHGYEYALKNIDWDYVIQMDADFSHDPNDIPRLIE